MKTILYIYHTSTIGGGSYCLLNILKNIDRTVVKPIVLLREEGPLVSEIKALDIPVYFLPTLSIVPYNVSIFTPKNILDVLRLIRSMSNYGSILNKLKPDVVYINTMMLHPYLYLAKKKGIKTIIHIREHWPEREHSCQRKIALNNIDKFADYIVAINSFSASMLNFSSKPKIIVYDWIDLSNRYKDISFSEIFNESMDSKKVYLFMGGMQVIKGTYEVLSTFSRVVTDPNARLLAMGFRENGYNNGWRGKIKRIFSILGYRTYTEKVYDVIKKDSRIKCIPSEYKINNIIQQSYCILSYFTIPHANLALAESIILGTPSIAADTEESREYSCNGELAVLFPINDLSSFEKAIMELDGKYNTILDNISRKSNEICQLFSKENNTAKLNELYKTI